MGFGSGVVERSTRKKLSRILYPRRLVDLHRLRYNTTGKACFHHVEKPSTHKKHAASVFQLGAGEFDRFVKPMERVFVNRADQRARMGAWSIAVQPTLVRATLAHAAARATHTGQEVLASLALDVPECDPLRFLRALQQLYPGQCFYWEQPSRSVALVGAGLALSLETDGAARFDDAARAVRRLSAGAVVEFAPTLSASVAHGPVLFGGFRFDPLHPRTELWRDFPSGLLVLPALLLSQSPQQTTLTLSQLVRSGDDLDVLTNRLSAQVARLSHLLAALPDAPDAQYLGDQEYEVQDLCPAQNWRDLVGRTAHVIRQGAYAKIVLARAARVLADGQPFSLPATLQGLRQSYPAAHVFAFQHGARAFLGATPERLLYAQNGQLHTIALAGSAPRGSSEEEDRRLGSELLHSPKNRQEHEIVTEMMRATLVRLCSRVWIADTPELLRLKNIQHLQTAITGELLPGRCILEALHILHPTPAVGGTPTEAALAYIREHEHLDRGWYAGPIGWVDLQGNGEFAVALRSALLEAHQATLFAGCGIMADSEPEAEYLESCLKLQVMLRNLSGEEERNG